MNFQELNSPEAKKFIQENLSIPVEDILLRARKFPSLNVPLLVTQIEGKNKAKKKLPTWYQSETIVYPVKLSMEQCSSETTAAYKANLINGDTLIDLTGGFGVDCTAFAGKMKKVIYIEQNKELAEIAAYNFKILGKNNIEVFNALTENFLQTFTGHADFIFLDPARRKEGNKVFRLSDCEPNIIALKEQLFKISTHVLLKTSPLLDIESALKDLRQVKEVHVVAVDNECKELLFLLDHKASETEIVAVNIHKDRTDEFRFSRKEEQVATVSFHMPMQYLYEPNAAILKAGAFKSVAAKTGLFKLNASSHLYTSEELFENFPGRTFRILKTLKYSKPDLMEALPDGKANITVRNFPDSVEQIRKKTGIKDGGDLYLFATKDLHDKLVILVTKKNG
ncbi:MAG TPA: class I SAM-dependent methyltransferase [Cytophagaceae bacterium]|nr:class I SAM-dependent methyltransferase [Cytophagaceae bacterium]